MLGLGAQKAGTTWLSRYLHHSRHFDRGYRKEYHVLDALDLPSEDWMRDRVVNLARRSLEAMSAGEQGDPELLHRAAMLADLDYYYDYFAGLVHRPGPVHATGDLTPDHAMLSADRMTAVREAFAGRGLRTVAVFLLRDPVERVWSHIRMKMHRHPDWFERDAVEELLAEHADPAYERRTRYHRTLAALTEAFAPEAAHVGLYERLFDDATQVHAISELVGIPPRQPRLAAAVNASPRPDGGLPDDVARTVATYYAETYREVARLRPDLGVGRWWPHARWVL